MLLNIFYGKKKDIKVIVSFDNTKYTQEEAILDKIELLFLLNEIKINQDYRNKKISEHEFNYLKYKIELMKQSVQVDGKEKCGVFWDGEVDVLTKLIKSTILPFDNTNVYLISTLMDDSIKGYSKKVWMLNQSNV